jgi:predicted acylesterase/phospholipase RssA
MLHSRFNLLRNITSRYKTIIVWIFSDPESIKSQLERKRIFQTEKNIFFIFSLSSLVALILYTISVFSLQFARHLSTVPIVLLSFGILLGAGNILTLISIKQKINLHFLFFLALIVAGFVNDSHFVKLHPKTPEQQHLERPALRDYFSTWIKTNQILETDSTNQFIPVYFVLAEGGASRSAYWTGSVLAELEKETKGKFSQNLFCLSGASGGSIGNMVFWQSRMRSKTINLSEIQDYLSNDLLSFPLARLLGPDLILPFIPNDILNNRAEALEQSLEFPKNPSTIGSFMQGNFSSTFPDLRNQFSPPVICINCTRMEDASPALISNIRLDTAIFGNRIDVLDDIQRGKDISVASAVVLGARFPYFCPAGRIGDDYFVDGGYFDNSGVGAAHEMILDLQDLIHDSLEVNPDHQFKKIQFHVVHISNKGDALLENGRIHPLINDLAAPIKTILGSYRSLTGFSNMRLQKYLQEIYKNKNTYHIINLYNVGEQSHYPLNWTISRQSLDSINGRLQSNKAIKSLVQFIKSPN